MQKIAVIGGGISGLSAAYYMLRYNPLLEIFLFEGNQIGGWIQTVQKNGFTAECGPRSFRLSVKAHPLLDMCDHIGIFDYLIPSTTSSSDALIFSDNKFHQTTPRAPFQTFKALLNPVYRRTILKNIFSRKEKITVNSPDFDMSIEELLTKAIKYANEEDKNFIVYTLADAMQKGIFGGDISKISARFCFPFSELFQNKYETEEKSKSDDYVSNNLEVINFYKKGLKKRSSAVNFHGGMQVLPQGIYKFLMSHSNFKHVAQDVVLIEGKNKPNPTVHTSKYTFEVDHIISTVPANILKKILKEELEIGKLCEKVTHNSIKTISVGFKNLNLKGVGYLVPSKEKLPISGVLFDSCSFPHLNPIVSIMGGIDENEEEMIKVFKKHNNVDQDHIFTHVSKCIDALPQYNVGHYKIVKEIEKYSPKWISISGQSFYISGIPNCVNQSRFIIDSLYSNKTLKKPNLINP